MGTLTQLFSFTLKHKVGFLFKLLFLTCEDELVFILESVNGQGPCVHLCHFVAFEISTKPSTLFLLILESLE
jgi:hypothetical protein